MKSLFSGVQQLKERVVEQDRQPSYCCITSYVQEYWFKTVSITSWFLWVRNLGVT